MNNPPNKPDAANPAIAPRLHAASHWRGIADPELSAKNFKPQ